jgi:hypothetical protein
MRALGIAPPEPNRRSGRVLALQLGRIAVQCLQYDPHLPADHGHRPAEEIKTTYLQKK